MYFLFKLNRHIKKTVTPLYIHDIRAYATFELFSTEDNWFHGRALARTRHARHFDG